MKKCDTWTNLSDFFHTKPSNLAKATLKYMSQCLQIRKSGNILFLHSQHSYLYGLAILNSCYNLRNSTVFVYFLICNRSVKSQCMQVTWWAILNMNHNLRWKYSAILLNLRIFFTYFHVQSIYKKIYTKKMINMKVKKLKMIALKSVLFWPK